LNPSQLQAAARRKYNSTGDTFFDDDEFFQLIYDAECQLATEAMVIENRYTTTSVASQREYAYPTRTIAIKIVYFDGEKLQYSNFREDDTLTINDSSSTQTGTPAFYQTWERTIFLRPVPSTAALDIDLYTYDLPNLQTSGTATLDTPTVYHNDIVHYLVAHMAAKDGNTKLSDYYLGLWLRSVQRAKAWKMKEKSSDGPRRVRDESEMQQSWLGMR